jgi:hypothetical protein
MFRTAIDIAGGMAAVVIAVCLGLVLGGAELPASFAGTTTQQATVNREGKTDALPGNASAQKPNRISVIEVIGVSDAAVVYRDRGGQLLFKTDPLSNVTVVAKNTVLPEVTVREMELNDVMPVPVEQFKNQGAVRELPNSGAPATTRKIPEGCESAFSAFIVPSQANKAGRCLSSLEDARKFSALN